MCNKYSTIKIEKSLRILSQNFDQVSSSFEPRNSGSIYENSKFLVTSFTRLLINEMSRWVKITTHIRWSEVKGKINNLRIQKHPPRAHRRCEAWEKEKWKKSLVKTKTLMSQQKFINHNFNVFKWNFSLLSFSVVSCLEDFLFRNLSCCWK